MSFRRASKEIRKARGQIKENCDHTHKFVHVDNNALEDTCQRRTLQERNIDVIENFCSESSTNTLEITNSISFSVPAETHSDMTNDINAVNVDEWLKQRTDSIDLEVAMRNDGMDSAYLGGNIGNSFLLNKDVDMTCIVTSVCDIGLSVDKLKDINMQEKDNSKILNSYSVNQDPLLNVISGNDILDKDAPNESSGIDAASEAKQERQEMHTSISHVGEQSKQCMWGTNENAVIQSMQSTLGTAKDKANWDGLVSICKIGDLDSEKDTDFPEFNLITFQIDAGDSTCSLNQFSELHTDINQEATVAFNTPNADKRNSELVKKTDENRPHKNGSDIQISLKKGIPFSKEENSKISIRSSQKSSTVLVKNNKFPLPSPSNILKNPVKNIGKRPHIIRAPLCNNVTCKGKTPPEKLPPSMAIIAISTDKSKNTTQIVINTPYGEQVYKGKTTDLMKATSGLWQKLDTTGKQKLEQPLTISTLESTTLQSTSLSNTEASTSDLSVPLCSDPSAEELEEMSDSEEKQSVLEALSELEIAAEDRGHIFCLSTGNGQKLWVCPVKDCSKMYPRRSMLKVHILTHFNIRPFKCSFAGCNWSFYTYFKLKRHKETHMKRKDFMCPVKDCERKFTTVYNLNTHLKLHTRPACLVCPVESCGSRFQTKHSLELHMKSHDRHHAPYRCHYEGCGKHYYSLNSLKSHSRIHQHKEEDLRCQWQGCSKIFDKPCRLRAHMRSHTGDKPYPCTYENCGWAFSSASKLKRHQQKHTNERNFRCTVEGCGKSFMRSEHLKEHTLTHIGQRSFKCPVENCGVRFSAKSSLYVHLKKHNKTEGSSKDKMLYHCPIEKCIRIYTCKSSLRQHMLKFHTPVLANDPSQLDYITLLTAEDDLAMLEGLQFSGDITQVTNGGMNSGNGISLTSAQNTDVVRINPSYCNTAFHLPGMATAQAVSGGSEVENSIVTRVVVAQQDTQSTYTASQTAERASVFEPIVMLNIESDLGSARTRFTYQDIVKERDKKRTPLQPTLSSSETIADMSSTASRAPKDVVLGTGLLGSQDISQSFLLQDDLAGNTLCPEDHMMAVGSGVGEYQVLLLDPSSRHEFAESTINLRDLE